MYAHVGDVRLPPKDIRPVDNERRLLAWVVLVQFGDLIAVVRVQELLITPFLQGRRSSRSRVRLL